tara:strand:- start:159 stop:923 length:765 start_codon:yes stop_codon:yes gene_type:complete
MAEVLTQIEETTPPGELNAEEQESLKVGEEMEAEQDSLLAGKYKSAEELEKAHIELQKKLGEKSETDTESKTEEKEEEVEEEPETSDVFDKLWQERNDGFSDDTLKELTSKGPGELAKLYLQYRVKTEQNLPRQLTDEDVGKLKEVAGGEAKYTQLMSWANSNLTEPEQKMFDHVIDRGDPISCFFAVQALMNKYTDSVGSDGKLITGKAPSEKGDVFESQAEMVRAMEDPRYDDDPAYRQKIMKKLERSNIQF